MMLIFYYKKDCTITNATAGSLNYISGSGTDHNHFKTYMDT